MKILHTSDWHLGKSLYDFSLLDDQEAVLSEIIGIAGKFGVDVIVIAGDIYDKPVPSGGAVALYDSFLSKVVMEMGLPVIAIAGNHDSAGRLEFGSSLYRASGYYITGKPSSYTEPVTLWDQFGEVLFYPIPYLHPADIRSMLKDSDVNTFDEAYKRFIDGLEIDKSRRNVAVAHGYFANIGASESKELITSDSEINIGGMDISDASCFDRFDCALLGHLHAPQNVTASREGGEVFYSGSPLKYSLSEERQNKSVAIIELGAKGEMSRTIVPLSQPHDVRTISGTFGQLSDPSYHKEGSFDDYVFANIYGDITMYPMEKLRIIFPNILGLSFTDQVGEARSVQLAGERMAQGAEELFARFYRDMKGNDIPDDRLGVIHMAVGEISAAGGDGI